jgi:hypothetical protein
MNKDLTLKLVKRFPVIYQDFYSPMSQTCVCWGFDHADGWFEIIWQLSLAIEEELGYSWIQERSFLFKKEFTKRWNNLIYKLSPVRLDEQKMEGKGTKEDPMHWVVVKKAEPTWDEKIAQFLFGKTRKCGRFEFPRSGLKQFAMVSTFTGFSVRQVKEKFGTLRFYCNMNDVIDKHVRLAERLSAHTCEVCGKIGELNINCGWYSTLCKDCAKPNSTFIADTEVD